MEIKDNKIKLNNNSEIKIPDLIWFIMIPIININYVLASSLAKRGSDLTIGIDNIIPFKSIFIIPYILVCLYCIRLYIYIIKFKTRVH